VHHVGIKRSQQLLQGAAAAKTLDDVPAGRMPIKVKVPKPRERSPRNPASQPQWGELCDERLQPKIGCANLAHPIFGSLVTKHSGSRQILIE